MSIPIEFNPMGRESKAVFPSIEYRFRSTDWPNPVLGPWQVWDKISEVIPPEGSTLYGFRFNLLEATYVYCGSDAVPDWKPGDFYIPAGTTEITVDSPDAWYLIPAVMQDSGCSMNLDFNLMPEYGFPSWLNYIVRFG